jgi:hypothetical protein
VIDADLIPESVALTHWDWTFVTLGKTLRLPRARISLIVFLRAAPPLLLNVWLLKAQPMW